MKTINYIFWDTEERFNLTHHIDAELEKIKIHDTPFYFTYNKLEEIDGEEIDTLYDVTFIHTPIMKFRAKGPKKKEATYKKYHRVAIHRIKIRKTIMEIDDNEFETTFSFNVFHNGGQSFYDNIRFEKEIEPIIKKLFKKLDEEYNGKIHFSEHGMQKKYFSNLEL